MILRGLLGRKLLMLELLGEHCLNSSVCLLVCLFNNFMFVYRFLYKG